MNHLKTVLIPEALLASVFGPQVTARTQLQSFVGGPTAQFFGWSVAGAGDVNGDGYPGANGGTMGEAWIVSGTGGVLDILQDTVVDGFFGAPVDDAGDVNRDGTVDLIIAAPGHIPIPPYVGRVAIFSTLTLASASVTVLGPGCGASVPAPTIASTPPMLGTVLTVTGAHAPASAAGNLYFSAGQASPPLVPWPGCPTYLSVPGIFLVAPIQVDASGDWQFHVTLPTTPVHIGSIAAVQALFPDGASPFGLEPSNGLLLGIGAAP